ncbi:cytosine permease [Alloyangia pacifica]|uniref:cytosine permease n=1 Tax=Alloyangia pacifica TaxID=311180 RepID=UPI001CFE1A25|nr:cytosine permease [Alloyangia pacifica]
MGGAYLAILGYVLIPWTAVNLTDYYLVRRGRCSITDIMRPDGGMYGAWGGIGIASYAIGFVAMTPFFSSAIYTGPLAASMHGVDVSFIVGLPVSSIVYAVLARRVDLATEMQKVREAALNTFGHA